MRNCKNPKCRKQLVGNEKWICRSCKDKGWDRIKTAGMFLSGLAALAWSVVLVINKSDSDSHGLHGE